MGSVHIKYVHSDLTEEEMDIHINKDSNVSDLLDTIKVKLNKEDEKHRLLEYVNGRIVTIHERNECITDPNMLASKLYRVEPVPQDQLKFAPGEVLIQVCHFNNMIQSVYGIPILIKIKNNEKLIEVRRRIQKTLNVPDKDFIKWKMALVINSSPKYYSELNDNELVNTSQFQVVTRENSIGI